MSRNLFISVCAIASVVLLFLVSTKGPSTTSEIEYKQFCDVIEATRNNYLETQNVQENAEKKVRLEEIYQYRMSFLADVYRDGKFSRWPVTFKSSSVLQDHELLKVELGFDCQVNLISYLRLGSSIERDISTLEPEQKIVLSGAFRLDDESGYFKEVKVSQTESLENPKFIINIRDFKN